MKDRDWFDDSPEMRMLIEAFRAEQELEARGEIKYFLDEVRFQEVKKSYRTLCALAKEQRDLYESEYPKVTLNAGTLSKSYLVVQIESTILEMFDMPAFIKAISVADNFDICPLADGEHLRFSILYDRVAKAMRLKPLKERLKITKPEN